MGLDTGVACLCGAATMCLLNAALEHVFTFDEPYDVISYGYDDIVFPAPNVAGGAVEFSFTVVSTEASLFPLKPLKKTLPMSKITFQCTGMNTRTQKQVIRLVWHLAYIATSDISSV